MTLSTSRSSGPRVPLRWVLAGVVLAGAGCSSGAPTDDATVHSSEAPAADPGSAVLADPPPLASHTMTYHDRLRQVVMFGGSNPDREPSNGLWGWNGERWTLLSRDGPAPRLHAGLAYDPKRDRLVLHGGIRDRESGFGDTWEWDGRWAQVGDETSGPGIRDHHALVHDPRAGTVLLFGGQDARDRHPPETWAWDGSRWSVVAEQGPPPRGTHRLIYDSSRERVVLFGGWGPQGQLSDTWLWDGARWIEATEEGPSARGATRLAYVDARDEIVLFGGLAGREVLGDTWVRSEGRWKELPVAGPAPRNVHGMAHDAARGRVVLYGGIGSDGQRLDDTWEWDGASWHAMHGGPRHVSFPTADGSVTHADVYDTDVPGGTERVVVLAHGARFDKNSWASQARTLAAAGFRVVAFDFRGRGQSGGGPEDGAHHDVLAAVRYARQTGAASVAVVGASFGGRAAARAAVEAPGAIDRTVLLAALVDEPERLPGRKLFILARDDARGEGELRLPEIREQYERAPYPKELVLLEGSAHAQLLFETEQGERLLREIVRFLSEP